MTGVQYGGSLSRTFRVDSVERMSSAAIYAAHTTKGYSKAYVQLDRWSRGYFDRLKVRLEYMSYPLPFFGIGASTPDSAEEWYSSGSTTIHAQVMSHHGSNVYKVFGIRMIRSQLREAEPGRAIESGSVHVADGWDINEAQLGILIDSRDHAAAPRSGTYARLISSWAHLRDPRLARLTLDARKYRPIMSHHSLALQLQYDGVGANTPFDQLAMLGADTAMRGYPRGRYRDNHALTAQAEFRSGYWRRAGIVAFAGVGTVAPKLQKLGAFPWYPTIGVGLRALLVPRDRTLARLDLGLGRGSFGINVGIGEAF